MEKFAPAAAAPVPPPLPSLEAAAGASVTFGNPTALRTALFIACLVTGLEIFPPLLLIAPLFGGLAAVMLFQKRTGRVLTTAAAVKLGWMTAVLNTLFGTIAITVTAFMEGLGPIRDAIRQQPNSPQQQQMLQMMNDPYLMAAALFMSWVFVFALISGLCIAGGALGARLARPRTS